MIFGLFGRAGNRRRPSDMYEVRANKQARDQYEHKGRLPPVETIVRRFIVKSAQ
jgi:hypothetical protein